MKTSRNPKRAVRLLAELLPSVTVEKPKGSSKFVIEVDGADPTLLAMEKMPISALAWLANLAKLRGLPREDVLDATRWTGGIPKRGLAGWEEEALEWANLNLARREDD